jgi:hypothetical protein
MDPIGTTPIFLHRCTRSPEDSQALRKVLESAELENFEYSVVDRQEEEEENSSEHIKEHLIAS